MAAGLLELRAHLMFACSSKRALISTTTSTCLPASRGVDQRVDDRRVTAGAVERLLDREHVRVGGRLLDECLHAGGERVVRVVHAGRRRCVEPRKDIADCRHRRRRQLRMGAPDELRTSAPAGGGRRCVHSRRGRAAPDPVDLGRLMSSSRTSRSSTRGLDRRLDFEAYRRTEAAAHAARVREPAGGCRRRPRRPRGLRCG